MSDTAARLPFRALRSRLGSFQSQSTTSVIETAAEAFIQTDANGRVTGWNRSSASLFGWDQDDIIGSRLCDTVFRWRDGSVWRALSSLAHTTTSENDGLTVELRAYRIDGEPIDVEARLWGTFGAEGERTNVLVRDVTERKQLAAARDVAARRQAQLLESVRQSGQANIDLVSMVSHELRSPLTSIIGYLEMMLDGASGPLEKTQISMLEAIDRNSQRLLALTESLLTLAGVESDASTVDIAEVDVAVIMETVEEAMFPASQVSNVGMKFEIDSEVGTVLGNGSQLERAMLNLVSNALKYTPSGGSVGVQARGEGESVVVTVADNGLGIPTEEQGRLFDRFFRSSVARQRKIDGTGLGLSIVKSIIDRHGGSIAIESTPDEGTTVTVQLQR